MMDIIMFPIAFIATSLIIIVSLIIIGLNSVNNVLIKVASVAPLFKRLWYEIEMDVTNELIHDWLNEREEQQERKEESGNNERKEG